MSESVHVSLISDLARVDRDTWNRLAAASRTATVFQSHEWHSAWWEVFGRDLESLLLCATEGKELVGVAALAKLHDGRGREVVHFMGHGHSDYSDIICAPDRNDVRRALLNCLLSPQASWDRMELRNVPADSPTVALLDRLARVAGRRSLMVNAIPCPTLLIHGHEEFFAGVLNKRSLRRHQNHFRKQPGYSAEHFRDAAQILPHLDAFFTQHIGRWAHRSLPSLFNEEQNRRFYRAMISALDGTGWLRFTRLVAGEQPIAFHLGFAGGGRFIWYKPTFDAGLARSSPGEALLKELLDLAAAEGYAEFDFTVGDEQFKQRFTNHVRYNVDLTVYSRRLQFERQRGYLRLKDGLKRSRVGRAALELARRVVAERQRRQNPQV